MTNNQLTDHKLTKIIESAEAVISALAGHNDDVHPDDSTKMCRLWDALNDDDATPEVVLVMAKEIQERRKADSEPVLAVSADLLHIAASAIEDLLEHTDPNTSYYSGVWADVPGKLRAAMLAAAPQEVKP